MHAPLIAALAIAALKQRTRRERYVLFLKGGSDESDSDESGNVESFYERGDCINRAEDIDQLIAQHDAGS
jgi:hypothetical protein